MYGPPPMPPRRTEVPGPLVGLIAALCLVFGGAGGCVLGMAAGSATPQEQRQAQAAAPSRSTPGTARTERATPTSGARITKAETIGGPSGVAVVRLTLRNAGGEPLKVNPLYFKLIGSDEQEYSVKLGGAGGSQMDVTSLSEGVSRTGAVAFEVPAGVTAQRIVFTRLGSAELASAPVAR